MPWTKEPHERIWAPEVLNDINNEESSLEDFGT